MPLTILLGEPTRYTGGEGRMSGVLINPNTNRLEYVLFQTDASADERAAPVGMIDLAEPGAVQLEAPAEQLITLSVGGGPAALGTLQSNLDNLCLARAGTPVRAQDERVLGGLRGLGLNEQLHIVQVLLDSQEEPLPVARIARYSTGELTVVGPGHAQP